MGQSVPHRDGCRSRQPTLRLSDMMSKDRVIGIACLLFGLILLWWCLDRKAVHIKGLSKVKPGVTTEEVLLHLGTPARKTVGTMEEGLYRVPNYMIQDIGLGNTFEMWTYEAESASNTQCAIVWFVPNPDLPTGSQVVRRVTKTRLRRSIWFRLCHSPVGKLIQDRFGMDE
jgi:hypothetical protein